MWRWLAAVVLLAGLGLAVVWGYVFVFAYRAEMGDWLSVQGLGCRMTGNWGGIILLAGFLSSLGCGLFALGLTWLLVLGRAGRPLLWGLLTVSAVLAVLAVVAAVWGQFSVFLSVVRVSEQEQERAEEVIFAYQRSLSDDLITEDFRRRLADRQELTTYTGQSGLGIWGAWPGEVWITGYVMAEGKTVWTNAAGGARRKVDSVAFPQPRRVSYTARAKKVDGGWLVDDFEYAE
jgi:hypothetical protein